MNSQRALCEHFNTQRHIRALEEQIRGLKRENAHLQGQVDILRAYLENRDRTIKGLIENG